MNSFKHLFLTKMVITFGAACFFRIVTVAAVESDVHNFIHVPLVARPNLSKTVN